MAHNLGGVEKVSESTLGGKETTQHMGRLTGNKEQFETAMTAKTTDVPSFEVVDKSYAAEADIENNPIIGDESVTSQNAGSATDQEKKRHKNQSIEEIEEVGAAKKTDKSQSSNSLMDEVSRVGGQVESLAKGGAAALKEQVKGTLVQIAEVKEKLANAKGEIKPSYQTILKNRLAHIDDNLKIAMNKAGLEYTPAPDVGKTNSRNPIFKFLDILTNSENQLISVGKSLESIEFNKKVSPAQLLAIQMKMNTISQQIELFTNVLNKALESIKTVMNVQV